MPIFAAHSLMLIAAVTGTYLWLVIPSLAPYTLQLVAVLILAYAAAHWLKRGQRPDSPIHTSRYKIHNTIPLDLTLLTCVILLLVIDTGALASPLIFLVYFLLFAVAMLFEIEATLVLTATLLVFFLLYPGTNLSDLGHLGELLALVMITPLALFTSHQYEEALEEKRRAKELEGHLAHEETDTLMFLSRNLKTTLTSALDRLSLVIPQAKVKHIRTDLEILYQDLRALYKSAGELQQTIDQETD